MSRPLLNIMLYVSVMSSGCESPSPPLPPVRYQSPPQAKLIRYGTLQLYLLRGSQAPSNWMTLHGAPNSEPLQKCALTLWNDKTWVTISEDSNDALLSYLSNLVDDPLPTPVEHDLCQP